MKRINKHNALLSKLPFWGSCGGFLFSLLLLLVTACSDEGREMAEIQQGIQESDEVELSIRTQIPEMEVGSRAATESITTITAFAFNGTTSESVLIKKVDALLSNPTDTTGTLKIKVPKRTRSIHFVAKNGASYDAGKYTLGETNLQDLLLNKTTTDLHYWGMLTFADAEALNVDNLSLTLYRNMAKVVLTSYVDAENDYIAGFLNYNGNGTLIPHDANGTLGYQANAVTLPEEKGTTSHDNQNLGTEYLLSEHANEEGNRIYAICYIGGKYYKIAFSNSSGVFFPLVRNHLYRIVINQISGGSDRYEDAKNADPINGSVREETMNVTTVPLTSYKGNTSLVTVTIPDGVTSLWVTSLPEQFDISSTEVTLTDNVCDVTGRQSVNFTLTLKDAYIGTTDTPTISFSGSGTSINATGTGTVTLNGFMDMYEMYVDNSNLNGSTEYDQFFHTRNNTNVNNQSLTTEYVDAGANSSSLAHKHTSAAINMQNESSITFTIADTRYLTLLVAKSNNAPSINITGTLKDGDSWSTENTAESLTTGKYNFGTDGDITISGRLIRYTLEPGTYTLQRGNNDYLLYYMRVSKEKPTMTDIVQPTAADYELAWSGGEYGNYLEDPNTNNGTKYYVDDDATTFTPTLTIQGLSDSPLTTTSLTVVTDTLYFKDNAQDVSGTTIIMNSETKSYNGNNPTLLFNAGTYNNLCGTIENVAETDYKYAAFYDIIQLKEVSGIEVKNTIKVGLYNDWYSTEALDHYTEGQLMMTGFKMPTHTIPVPVTAGDNGTVTPIEFRIDNWTRDQSGLGIDYSSAPTYRLTAQDETQGNNIMRTHPRPEWIYRIQWANVAAESMTVVITDNSSDAYFSHKEQIGKSVTIVTAVENTSLDIELDFYSGTENRDDNNYSNLELNSSHFYLKAIISQEDATKYADTPVTLVNTFSGNGYQYANSYGAIHWDNSSIDANSSISSNSDATQLNFTVDANTTEYVIEWVFVTGSHYTGYGDIGFAYAISNSQGYNVTGDTSATIGFTNEPVGTVLLNTPHTFTKNGDNWTALTFDGPFPIGTKIILTFGTGGGIKLCDGSNNNLYVPAFASNNLYGSGGNSDLWMTAPTGNLVLDITEDIILYGKGTGTNNGNLSANYPLNDLIIESGETVLDKVVVVYPEGYVQEEEEENEIYTGPFTFTNWNNLNVDGTFTIGTKVTFKFSTGGIFKIHNGNWQMLYIPTLANRYPQEGYNRYIEVVAGEELSFVVDNNIRFQTMNYDTNEQTGDVIFTGNSFSGLVLQGDGGTVLESITTITP